MSTQKNKAVRVPDRELQGGALSPMRFGAVPDEFEIETVNQGTYFEAFKAICDALIRELFCPPELRLILELRKYLANRLPAIEYRFKLIDSDHELPLKVPCPICGDRLTASFEQWSAEPDGSWVADSVLLQCVSEPPIDAAVWRDWHEWHYRTPYIDWLPVNEMVLQAVNKAFRFRMSFSEAN